MRVKVIGTSISAVALRSSLYIAGVAVADDGYGYTVEITETKDLWPTIDGIDCELERRMVSRICDCANTRVILDRPGGNRSDEYIRIGIPANANAAAIERGIMQAIVQLLVPQPQPSLSAWKKTRRWLAALIYASCFMLSAQIIPRWPIIQSYAVSALPGFGVRNRVAVVTDALSSTSCLIGGGTTVLLCRDTGSTWEVLSGSGGSTPDITRSQARKIAFLRL